MAITPIVRPLTIDEKNAAEAAFQRGPFNPAWTGSALVIYNGIAEVMARRDVEKASVSQDELECVSEPETVFI